MEKIKISDAELEVMKLLWATNDEVSTNEIVTQLQAQNGWDRSTIRTLIKRLVEKGAITQKKKEVLCYQAAITENHYINGETKSFIDKLYRGSAKNLVASLVDSDHISEQDLNELRTFLMEKER